MVLPRFLNPGVLTYPMISTTCWAVLHIMQYGFAITSLNGIQQYVTCQTAENYPEVLQIPIAIPIDCIPMTTSSFGIVVSIFTLGGLLGSLAASTTTSRYGQVGTLRLSAAMVFAGSTCIGFAGNTSSMLIGRILVGIGCGLSTVTVPVFVAQIAPPSMKRSLGISNQISIVIGMLAAQSLSFPFAHPDRWRFVFIAPAMAALIQLGGSLLVNNPVMESQEAPELEALLEPSPEVETLTIKDLFLSREPHVTKGFHVVLATQMSQQLCGVAPVMYFSTRILTPVFQGNSRLMALIVVLIKLPITVLPVFLIERLGSRRLLVLPTSIMCFAALLLALGINTNAAGLSIVGIILFVVAFSIGLGPVTWVVLPEVMPSHAVNAAGSVGLALNWVLNFAMGAAFLPIQQTLSGGVESREGNVFFILSVTCAIAAVAIKLTFRRYDRRIALA
ncbi:vacuolar membrane protein [Cryptococcus neoformans C23]|uniref:Vacuolar membrane protein n=1 Tax=Cryptococcus neoformans (strain H99 / ATCC 208821 / CBS 10515 / FGSC 9487) TaxID=235443 RepID=J9VX53_CRYN9|nr:vacuolar membrane protein [Cryptococcus neoformans var. grubii H99]AUB28045.1 vacuolar membrane protein [Cryptococcus neoformans var. grubii]OWZ27728.1 vacuolar membrane protein [Cryptococcus neoformans var. grubii AD2-60a]OWZ40032.1 vacuolar membrane protein [Cryptococcus neoformans var. grubii C23]OXC81913.1 vacuolar membrane protein [Cryptococcus neoformans var. grubii AD1-7a]OXG34523.1 vacuolar membrane protein [Cryptococcus neoformans var. grubii Bt120]|eukprot:XP_012052444.1 vacuolar membrane protein [Cryptococcus neoformans var. grubii H99]